MQKLDEKKASVVIPAYNQPDYLRRALASTIEQTHRPVEIIVSDDCSPVRLEPIVREFAAAQDHQLTLRFYRQSRNLGVMDNFRFTVAEATGKYLVPMAHDNRFIDNKFIAEAVDAMVAHDACHLCMANSVFENSDRQMLAIPDGYAGANGWIMMDGADFIRRYRRGGMDWTQAIVLDHEMASELRAYDAPFMVNAALAKRLNSGEDNVCAYVFLLSAIGSVALNSKCVCEIGTPTESYSRSDPQWLRTKQKVKFVIFYNLYRADLRGPNAAAVKRMAFRQALDYVDHICDRRIARYYRYQPEILLLIMVAFLKRPWTELRYYFKRKIGRNPFTGKPFKKTHR
jgi:glycosyltransferase involved in cell wall biosynthesis